MLVGLVKKNGIMMVDFAIEARRREGLSAAEAIYEACLVRFRPIMMTTMAALMGTLPIALGLGAGAEARRPLGLAVVGGLLVSQTLTLYVTPVFYIYMEHFQEWLARPAAACGSPSSRPGAGCRTPRGRILSSVLLLRVPAGSANTSSAIGSVVSAVTVVTIVMLPIWASAAAACPVPSMVIWNSWESGMPASAIAFCISTMPFVVGPWAMNAVEKPGLRRGLGERLVFLHARPLVGDPDRARHLHHGVSVPAVIGTVMSIA